MPSTRPSCPRLALRVARNENRLPGIARRRGGDIAGNRLDLAGKPGLIHEPGGVEDKGQHIVGDGLLPLMLRRQRSAAHDRPRQKLAGESQRITLVVAHGQDRAARILEQGIRIGRGPAGAVEQQIGVELAAFIGGDADLAHGHLARRHVDDDRPARLGRRKGDADRIGRQTRIAAAIRRHIGFMADHIDEMQRDQPGRGALLAIAADPADVMGIAQRHGNEPGLAPARSMPSSVSRRATTCP